MPNEHCAQPVLYLFCFGCVILETSCCSLYTRNPGHPQRCPFERGERKQRNSVPPFICCPTCRAASSSIQLSPFSACFVCCRTLFKRPSLQPTKLHHTLSPSRCVVGQDSRLAAARMQKHGPFCLCFSGCEHLLAPAQLLPHGRRTQPILP